MTTISPPWTAVHSTSSSSVRQPVARRGVIVHHHAGTNFANLRSRILGPAVVSYTAITNRTQLELMLPNDARRPWSANNAYWDSAMRSICLNNLSTAGWTIHDETVWSAARAIAFWASTEGWWPHRNGDPRSWTIIGHGEIRPIHGASNATACPGGVPLGLLTYRAQALMTGSLPIEEEDEETTMGTIILRTPQRGHYTVSPGMVSALTSATVATAVEYWQGRTPPRFLGVQVWDVADADLEQFIFALSGSPVIPPAAQTWAIVDGAFRPVLPAPPAGFDADYAHDQSDLDAEGHDIHPTDAPYPEEGEQP